MLALGKEDVDLRPQEIISCMIGKYCSHAFAKEDVDLRPLYSQYEIIIYRKLLFK